MRAWLGMCGIAVLVAATSCGQHGPEGGAGGGGGTHASASRRAESGEPGSQMNARDVPPALKLAALRAEQQAPGYDFVRDATGALASRAGDAAVRATDAGVLLTTAEGAAPLGFDLDIETLSVGRDGTPSATHVRERHAEGQELVLSRDDGVEERFLAGPHGLEQSYSVAAPPRGDGRVVVDVAFRGLAPRAVEGATDRVELVDEGGTARAGYSDLVAVDATGRALDARMEVRGGGVVALSIDDDGAAYPISIDPVVWTLQTEVVAPDGAANDFFGYAVAVSGLLAVVGAPGHSVGGKASAGAAYIFVQSGTTWSLQQEITAGDAAAGDGFGSAVAISGGKVVIGAPLHAVAGKAGAGVAYVFVQSGVVWSQQQEMTASDAAAGDEFGYSVGLSGALAIVGAPNHAVSAAAGAGSAYVFAQSGVTWSQQQELTASDRASGDAFGTSVSVSQTSAGTTAIVGARRITPSAPRPRQAPPTRSASRGAFGRSRPSSRPATAPTSTPSAPRSR